MKRAMRSTSGLLFCAAVGLWLLSLLIELLSLPFAPVMEAARWAAYAAIWFLIREGIADEVVTRLRAEGLVSQPTEGKQP